MKTSRIFKILKFVFTIVLFANYNGISAQEYIEGNNSILWEISGNGLDKPSYIYGLGDNICKEDIIFNDIVLSIIQNTEQIVFDGDISAEAQAKQQTLLTQKKNISDAFTEKDKLLLNEFYKANYGADLTQLGFYKPFVLEILIKNKWGVCKSPYDIRTDIVKVAGEKQIEVIALESPEDQIAIYDGVPEDDFIKSISKTINDKKKFESISQRVYDLYKIQNQDKLIKILKEIEFVDSNLERVAIIERHQKWLPKIEKIVKEKPSFIAVGNAHILPLGYDLISLLKKRGYILKAIKL